MLLGTKRNTTRSRPTANLRNSNQTNSTLIFSQKSQKDLSQNIQIDEAEDRLVYEPMQRLCLAFNKTIFSFEILHCKYNDPILNDNQLFLVFRKIFNEFDHEILLLKEAAHKKEILYQELLELFKKEHPEFDLTGIQSIQSDREVYQKILLECKKHPESNMIITINELKKIQKMRGFKLNEEGFKIRYSKFFELNEHIKRIPDRNEINQILKELNKKLMIENTKRNIKDRVDYYCNLNDKQIYKLFISPIVSFHKIILSLTMPHVAIPSIITATLSTSGISIARELGVHFIKRTYNVGLRSNNHYSINSNALEGKISENKLESVAIILDALRQMNAKVGQFNFYFSNSFKYYTELKRKCDYYTFNRNLFLEQNSYDNEIKKIHSLYYKTLHYSRNNKILASTLKLQIESYKKVNLQIVNLLCNNSNIKKFFTVYINSSNENSINIKNKFLNFINIKYPTVNPEKAKTLADFIRASLIYSKVSEDEIKTHSNLSGKEQINSNIEDLINIFSKPDAELGIPKETLDIIEQIPSIHLDIEKIEKNEKFLIDFGPWITFSAIEGMLYLSNTVSTSQKYQKIKTYLNRGASAINVGQQALGLVNYFECLTNLFSVPAISSLAINPFSFIFDLTNKSLSNSVSNNEEANWADIVNNFETFKTQNKNHNSAYEYFIKHRPSDPSEAMHKICDLFKKKLSSISDRACDINLDVINIINSIESFNNPSTGFFSKFQNKITENDIIENYARIFIKILALAKDIEAYDFYLNNIIKDINNEIDKTLQLYLVLIGVNHRGVFSLIKFASSCPNVYNYTFNEHETSI